MLPLTRSPATHGRLEAAALFASWQHQLDAAPQILVAVSGGLDSTVLLHLLSTLVPAERICAVHIHHGLSANADAWQHSVEDYCQSLGVQLFSQAVEVTAVGEGIEAAARKARYQVFEHLLQPGGLLLLGHHGDDQVETMLYQLLRGSGAKGLSGMPVQRPLGRGRLIRPLLSVGRDQLQAYAELQKLSWVEDESNIEERFDRNYLRKHVVPAIAQRWPDYRQSMQLSAEHSSEAQQLAEALAREDLATLHLRQERGGWSVCIEQLLKLDDLRQRNIYRHWPALQGLPMPNKKIIAEINSSVVRVREDAEPLLEWQGTAWRRFQGRLYLLVCSGAEFDSQQQYPWALDQILQLADGSQLVIEDALGEGLALAPGQLATVGYRQGGERCKPKGRGHSNSLKKLFLEYRVEPWWRDRTPLLYVDKTLVAVGDYWICEGWQAPPGQPGKKIRWQGNSL
jgi:tRNA(Ile)-lysidine synthase